MATDPIEIAPFEATPLDRIPAICATVANTFRSQVTKDIEWRKVQLRRLYWGIVDYTPQLCEALRRDLNKSLYESMQAEIDFMKYEILFLLKHLDRLAGDEAMGSVDVPLLFRANNLRVRKDPLGAVLVMGAYNFPAQLLLVPFVGAVAAGCTAVIKPSELSPATAMVLRALIEDRMDRNAYAVVNGAIPENTALLDFRDPYYTASGSAGAHAVAVAGGEEHGWAKIFYTGNRQVARIILAKAAQTLTPVTLELGGRNPAFITAQCPDVRLAARRLLWGKSMNAGQVCLSHNYVLVDRRVLDAFVAGLQAAFELSFPVAPGGDPADVSRYHQLSHIVNERHFVRIKKMLDDSKGRVVMGGYMDAKTRLMTPTAVIVDSVQDSVVMQESFGPLFAILPVNSVDEAIRMAHEVDATPLALSVFASKDETKKILREVTSGGATINDSFMHAASNLTPFGGVGHSGNGTSRGQSSFFEFTHKRTVAHTPTWTEALLRVRYMPYDLGALRLPRLLGPKANFDRAGVVNKGLLYWLRLFVGLGSSSRKGAWLRWCSCVVATLAVYAARR